MVLLKLFSDEDVSKRYSQHTSCYYFGFPVMLYFMLSCLFEFDNLYCCRSEPYLNLFLDLLQDVKTINCANSKQLSKRRRGFW